MFIELLTKPFAYLYFKYTKSVEKSLGYALKIPKNKKWIPGVMIADMTFIWQRFGIQAKGVNYFTIGAIQKGLSSRFDDTSPYYQGWIGGYVVEFGQERKWDPLDHLNLGVADQKNWLNMYGEWKPYVEVDKKAIKKLKTLEVDGYKGDLYEGAIWSNTDVGDNCRNLFSKLIMSCVAHIMNWSNQELKLSYQEFIPLSSQNLSSYQKIYLKGYLISLDIDAKTKVVLYASAAVYEDKFQQKQDTYAAIKKELLELIKSFKIVQV